MEWVSVKERLPSPDQDVFMKDEDGNGLPLIGWYEKDAAFEGFVCEECFRRTRLVITHWMPIPEPPKNHEEEITINKGGEATEWNGKIRL